VNPLRIGLIALLLLGVTAVRADDKKDPDKNKAVPADDKKDLDKNKLVGNWVVTKGQTLDPGTTWEFTKDGKATVVLKNANGTVTRFEGTYKIKGPAFTITGKLAGDDYEETLKVPTLTDKKLVLVDEDGKEDTLEKK
jgi:uncharacterized protein (TIGR03066 family)